MMPRTLLRCPRSMVQEEFVGCAPTNISSPPRQIYAYRWSFFASCLSGRSEDYIRFCPKRTFLFALRMSPFGVKRTLCPCGRNRRQPGVRREYFRRPRPVEKVGQLTVIGHKPFQDDLRFDFMVVDRLKPILVGRSNRRSFRPALLSTILTIATRRFSAASGLDGFFSCVSPWPTVTRPPAAMPFPRVRTPFGEYFDYIRALRPMLQA